MKKYGLRCSVELGGAAYAILGSRTRPTAQTAGVGVVVMVPKFWAKTANAKGLKVKHHINELQLKTRWTAPDSPANNGRWEGDLSIQLSIGFEHAFNRDRKVDFLRRPLYTDVQNSNMSKVSCPLTKVVAKYNTPSWA